jgi:hypothetical protein
MIIVQRLMYIYTRTFILLSFSFCKFKEPELADKKSENWWLDIARAISTFQAEASITSDIKEKPDYYVFDARRPVRVPKHINVLAPRFMEYARRDLDRFQRRICERPFNKDVVVSEIDDNMKLWSVDGSLQRFCVRLFPRIRSLWLQVPLPGRIMHVKRSLP